MPSPIQLVIVTTERQLLNHPVVEVTLPGADGELGVLPGHAPRITELAIGELSYQPEFGGVPPTATANEVEQKFGPESWRPRLAIIRGFAEVLGDRVTVLAETAERPEEIDVERARAA